MWLILLYTFFCIRCDDAWPNFFPRDLVREDSCVLLASIHYNAYCSDSITSSQIMAPVIAAKHVSLQCELEIRTPQFQETSILRG